MLPIQIDKCDYPYHIIDIRVHIEHNVTYYYNWIAIVTHITLDYTKHFLSNFYICHYIQIIVIIAA